MQLSAHLAAMNPGLLLLLVVGSAVAAAVAGLVLVRRMAGVGSLALHNDVTGAIFAVAGTCYAVLAAFAIVQVWDQWGKAQDDLAVEDGVARAIYRHLRSYPDRAAARPALDQYEVYVRSVLDNEFPALGRLQPDATTQGEFQKMWDVVSAMKPSTYVEQVSFSQTYELLGRLSEYRSMRLEAAEGHVPQPLWEALLVASFCTIVFICFFAFDNLRLQVVFSSLLTAVVAMLFYVVVILNHPFTGSVRVEPKGYVVLLDLLQETKRDGRDLPPAEPAMTGSLDRSAAAGLTNLSTEAQTP